MLRKFFYVPFVLCLVRALTFFGIATAAEGAPCITRQELTARSPGIVERVFVSEGQEVKKGDKIIELDSRLYQAGLKEALAALDVARANEELASDSFARLRKLESGEGVSEQQLAEARLRSAQAKGLKRQAEAAAERVKIQLEDATIRARVNGRVHGIPTTLGLAVQAGQSLGRIDVVPPQNCLAPQSQIR